MMSAFRTLLLCGLAIAALYGMRNSTPGYGDITAPIAIRGAVGERVETRDFAFGAANVHLARQLKVESFGRVKDFSTSGIWLVIEGAAVSKTETMTLMSAEWLASNGVRYALSQRFSTVPGYLPTERLEPGLPRPVLLAFELPEAAVDQGTLLVARSRVSPLAEELSIALGDKKPAEIKPSVTIARSGSRAPWTLAAH
ncbi:MULTISPECIES: hypothetical protein [Ensifer]|nr:MULTISPECIES: hypothetical protein [Ensifer]MBD9498440.1 hypothetical protein [Ensifer sp. ENS01]MBD9573148.1 hypothetical protein [Ensifer sp. ENS08]OWZ89466.1 hypothetical protein B9J07_32705 [Sinorhizobium sp. LM21]KQX06208.1 hypothetical protein ASD01_11565 [Ensifer sp. Root423]KQZ50264.1 hypothetical protein ASD63_30450 [Ensifer sp. Root558]